WKLIFDMGDSSRLVLYETGHLLRDRMDCCAQAGSSLGPVYWARTNGSLRLWPEEFCIKLNTGKGFNLPCLTFQSIQSCVFARGPIVLRRTSEAVAFIRLQPCNRGRGSAHRGNEILRANSFPKKESHSAARERRSP